jgi:hypothetical protein
MAMRLPQEGEQLSTIQVIGEKDGMRCGLHNLSTY